MGSIHTVEWLSHEKEQSSDTGYHVEGPWTHDAQWEKPDPGGQVFYNSIYMKYPEEANPLRKKAG